MQLYRTVNSVQSDAKTFNCSNCSRLMLFIYLFIVSHAQCFVARLQVCMLTGSFRKYFNTVEYLKIHGVTYQFVQYHNVL